MRLFCLALFGLVLSLVVAETGVVLADGPGDNLPDKVRPIPPKGVDVPAADREELQGKLSELAKRIAAIKGKLGPQLAEHVPDVQVLHDAVRTALDHNEFFGKDDIGRAKQLLTLGLERVEQLAQGRAPWVDETGLVVGGYVSKIDGSIQPFGLVVPPSYTHKTAGRYRLDIWFHGRGETLSEVNFLHERTRSKGQFTPPDTIVLHPYGRYCNAFKFAGEVDVLEALAAVKRRYRVDDDRVSVRGFSMGGAAAWHFAVHYPGNWFAANPGAGFAETPEFLRMSQGQVEQLPPWEKKLLHYYDCTDWAGNLYNLPTVAYSGELDGQKQAADIMATAMKSHGLELRHVIGPKTKHAYHPEGAKTVEADMTQVAKRVSASLGPQATHFQTFTLKYNQCDWLQIDALQSHWNKASVHGSWGFGLAEKPGSILKDERQLTLFLETTNVEAMTFRLPPGSVPRNALQHNVEVIADIFDLSTLMGPKFVGPKPNSDGSWSMQIHRENHEWKAGPIFGDALRKRHNLQGPIDDAFMDSFIFVRPTGTARHEAVEKWSRGELERAIREWRRQFRGEARVKDDTQITEADIASANLVLWGDASSNKVIARLGDKLPIRWDGDAIEVGTKKFAADKHAVAMIYPNPLNSKRYVVLNSGFTYREYDYLNNARQVPKLPDWAVFDLTTPPNTRYAGKVVAADFFDERWQVAAAKPGTPGNESSSSVPGKSAPRIVDVHKIWDGAKHNAFTDLIRFGDRWLCVFRESEAHVGGDGKIRVIVSDDAKAATWRSLGLISETGIDLRDPKLSVTPTNELMLVAGGSVYKGGKTLLGRQPRVFFSKDGREGSEPIRVLAENDWLWRVTWHNGKAYGVSYRTPAAEGTSADEGEWTCTLFESADGRNWKPIMKLDVPGRPNETTLRFTPQGECLALIRREGTPEKRHAEGYFGRSQPPYKEWKWREIGRPIGGPNFIVLPSGAIWAVGRDYRAAPEGPKTAVGPITEKGWEIALTLPSGGDTSYAGMVWHEGELYVSYYSSHEGKSNIYLARVDVGKDGMQSAPASK